MLLSLGCVALLLLVQVIPVTAATENAFAKKDTGIPSGGETRPEGPPLDSFVIDLDLAPADRWKEVMESRLETFHTTMDWIVDHSIPPNMLSKFITALNLVQDFWPKPEYRAEITGIARATGRDPGLILLLNLVYELSAGCTSIVAQHSDGSVWHGRNLDFDIPRLQDLVVDVHFTQGKDLVYQGTTYAGYIGVLTGVKPNAFSLSQDQRETGDPIWENLLEFLVTKGKAAAYPFLYRDLFKWADTYDEALEVIVNTPTIAPAYAILAGTQPGEGAVVSRDRDTAVDVWTLSDDRWFLVETNDDHWKPPNDDRREAANHSMSKYTPQSIGADALWDVMTQHPTLNELTTYTAVMNADKDYYESVLENVGTMEPSGKDGHNDGTVNEPGDHHHVGSSGSLRSATATTARRN